MRTPKHVQAFSLLCEAARRERESARPPYGPYLTIEKPVEVLERRMKISRPSAATYLQRLERMELISLERGVGQTIQSARLLKNEIDIARHELSEEERLIAALQKNKRRSQNGSSWIIHAHDFDLVKREADLSAAIFYLQLRMLEERGMIRRVFKTRSDRMLFVVIN